MASNEIEDRKPLDKLFVISQKTPYGVLREFSRQYWPSTATRAVARDIVKNGRELLPNTNWDLVLPNIRIERYNNSVQFGLDAIAVTDARPIGSLAVAANLSMHDPPIVYLSARALADRVGNGQGFEDFKEKMRQAAIDYAQTVFYPKGDLYKKVLDFLLDCKDRKTHRTLINRMASFLGSGDIESAYNMVKSWDNSVRSI